MKMYWGNGGIAPTFILSALYCSEWSSLHHCQFTFIDTASGNGFVGGWLGPRVSLYAVETTRLLSLLAMEFTPLGYSSHNLVTVLSYPRNRP
jgi:hypothetical protein